MVLREGIHEESSLEHPSYVPTFIYEQTEYLGLYPDEAQRENHGYKWTVLLCEALSLIRCAT